MSAKLLMKGAAIFDHSINFLAVVAGVIVVFVMFSITAEVISRKLLGYSLIWVIEYSELSLVFVTFLGAAWLLRREGHVKLDIVINRLTPRSQAMLNTITSIIGVIICLALAWYGTKVSWDHFQRGITGLTLLAVPTFPRYAAIAIGGFLLSIQFLRRSYGYLRSWRVLLSRGERS